MSRFGIAIATAHCVALVSICSIAAAEDAATADVSAVSPAYPRIHLDVSSADGSTVPLLRAELGELGLTVVDGEVSGPSITLHASLDDDSLEVRITDDETGKTLVRELFSVGDGHAMDPRTAVLHASELLRWHLHYRAAPPDHAPPPPSTIRPALDRPKPAPADLRFSVLPTAIYSPGGASLGLGAELDVLGRWRWLGVRVLGASSLVPVRISVPEGQLQISSTWAGVEGTLVLEPKNSATALELGLGGALFTSTLHGTAVGQNFGRDDRVLTAALLVDARARARITHGLNLVLASSLTVPVEASRLRVLDRQVGTYGRAIITFGLGLELTLF